MNPNKKRSAPQPWWIAYLRAGLIMLAGQRFISSPPDDLQHFAGVTK